MASKRAKILLGVCGFLMVLSSNRFIVGQDVPQQKKATPPIVPMTYEQEFPKVKLLNFSVDRTAAATATYAQITPFVGIRRSDSVEKTYVNWVYNLGNVDTARFRVFISSLPETNADVVVDDILVVNGHAYGGWSTTTADPGQSLGQNPVVCYRGVPAIDISNDLRRDGVLFVRAMDASGGFYGCSTLYVRVEPR